MKNLWPILIFALLTFSSQAHAYVTYNRLGYLSCQACHYDPLGGGLLTGYGQGVQGAMSAFPTEVMPGEQRIWQGTEVRAIELNSASGANPFLMQGDYLATAFITQHVHFDGAVGPNLREGNTAFASVPSGWDGIVLRRALFTADFDNGNSLSVGRDAAVAGLNIEDHTSFLRSVNRRGLYDYPTQVRYIVQSDKYQFMPFIDTPSGEEAAANQEYGGGFRGEYILNPSNSLGLTSLYGNTAEVSRSASSFFWRLSEDHWNGFEGEYVLTYLNEHDTASFWQQDVYAKPYIAIPEWIETGFVYEFLHVGTPYYQNSFQYGPSVNIRLYRYVSLLGDGRNLGVSGTANWSWYGQIFLHVQI